MPLSPRDRRTVRAVVLERMVWLYTADGWQCGRPRGDGYVLVAKRFESNAEVASILDALSERHVTAWCDGDRGWRDPEFPPE